MNTDKKVVYRTTKYALNSSTLHNIANIDKNIITDGQRSDCAIILNKTNSHKKKLFMPLSVDSSNLCETIGDMKLRSRIRQSSISREVTQKSGTKIRKAESLDSTQQSQRNLVKQMTSDKLKKPAEPQDSKMTQQSLKRSPIKPISLSESFAYMKLRSHTRKENSSKDENGISLELPQKIGTKIRKAESLDSSKQLQPVSKKPKISNIIKERTELLASFTQRNLKKAKTSDKFKESIEFKHSKEIENVLNESRLNLKDRFYIKSSNWCENFQHCQTKLSQKIQLCDYYTKNSTKMLLAETRVLNFLKSLDGMIFREVFPGVELIIELIGTILTYDSIDKSATNECIIAGSLNTFHRIMFKFPPCVANIKIEYQNLITESSYKSDIISLPNFEFQNGIFWKLIEMLETLIENDIADDEELNLSQQSEDGFDFYTWEKRQITQHYRHNIPRDDKIDRIFYILHFLTNLMEHEFANWCQRLEFENKNEEKAIIIGVIWPNDVPGTITMNVKRIITLFIKFVAVDFPDNKIKILSSIVTLIGNVMLHATAKNFTNIYPNRNFTLIESLSKEMFKIVTDVQPSTEYSKVKFYSLIITHLELSALKMLFGNVVIDKIENLYTHQLNLEKLFAILKNDSWKIVAPKQILPKSPAKIQIRNVPNESNDSLYPIYSKNSNKRGKPCESINFEEYIIVLFETFKSYLNYFKLDKILRELKDPFDKKSSSLSSSWTESPLKQVQDSRFTTAKINFKLVEKNLTKSLKLFDINEKLNKLTKTVCNNNNVLENVKIDNISLKLYHSDIEFYDQIVKCIQTGKDVYFRVFKEFINESNLID